ncbi:conserved hypothetical protein [Pantoea brenneri]|uniref:Uncharacterized protein n=1 Tax=Pantoea brenneri TaxID=472694 RepID=A0AAX3J7P5_9GAMM|nr:hypothetical protein [Pantoea brenneri]VXC11969.1 conserved hypothetical protein [Pantoea brenneri]
MLSRIECDIAQDETDCEKIAAIIQRNILKISPTLVGDLQWYSQNARLVPGSLKIISVKKQGPNSFKLLYDFDWNVFSPCQDLNETVSHSDRVSFHIEPGALEFDVIANQRPSPSDEL